MINRTFNNHHFINKKNLFIFTIVIKVCILTTFTSEYSRSLFFPFIETAVTHFINPWNYYLQNRLSLDVFPYHGLMLYILSPFSFAINFLGIKNYLLINLIFKLPLLFADIILFFTLLKLFSSKYKEIFLYYFLNPIVIYAIYIHSQLDIIPMTFLVLGVYFLTINKLWSSAIFIGCAIATKHNALISLPLLIFFQIKRSNIRQALVYCLVVLTVIFLFDLPFLFSDGFVKMVLLNPKQSLLFEAFYKIGDLKLLIPIASILMVYLHFINQNKVNNDLLYFYLGILFTSIIFFIYPSPAWYVWLVPFVSIYFIQNGNMMKYNLLYVLFSIAYIIFFVFFYQSEYKDILFLGNDVNLKIKNAIFINIAYTLLESMVLAVMYAFYRYGIRSNSIYKKQTNLIIGIGGDSGAGKSSLLSNLTLLLGNKFLKIEGDDEHKWEREDENWNHFTHLDPKANYIHRQADSIYKLKHNNPIFRSEYDHSTGKFQPPQKVDPKEFIAISGLHPFYLPKLRRIIDLKIYIDTDETLRCHWKIIRDTKKRGYNIDKIIEQLGARTDDSLKYINPQKVFADIIIRFFPICKIEPGDYSHNIDLGLKITIDANINLEDLLNKLDCEYIWDYNEDLNTQFIEMQIEPQLDFKKTAWEIIPNINEITDINPKWLNGYQGFLQLVILMMISDKLKEENR